MIRRILNAYTIEYIKYSRQPLTFVGPVLVVVLVLLAPLNYPLERDGVIGTRPEGLEACR